MIKLPNGHELEFVVASGALGWNGGGWLWEKPLVSLGFIDPSLFTVTTKTMTLKPNKGRWWAVRPMRGGVWNNMGLPNKGMSWWLDKYLGVIEHEDFMFPDYPFITKKTLPYKTLVSIAPRSVNELREMVGLGFENGLESDSNFVGYEINVSCPNTVPLEFNNIESMLEAFADRNEHSYKPCAIILKLNYQQAFYSEGFTTEQLRELLPYCDAVSLNSAPPAYGKGAYSGRLAQECNWTTAAYLQCLGFKVIYPSLWVYEDIQKVYDRGAQAISFGAVHLLRPWAATNYVRRWRHQKGVKI